MLRQRLLSGSLLGVAIILLVFLDAYLASTPRPIVQLQIYGVDLSQWVCNGLISTAIVLVLTWLTVGELIGFARALGCDPFDWIAKVFAAGLVLGPYVSYNLKFGSAYRDESWGMLALAVALGLAFFAQAAWRRTHHAMMNLSTTLFILFYTGGLAGFMLRLRLEVTGSSGALLLLFSVFVVKSTDMGAYFIGSLIGRNKLIHWLSPKKTWEGFFGGLLVAVLVSVGVGHLLIYSGHLPLTTQLGGSVVTLAIFGVLAGVTSVAGDLCASLLKRDAEVKDSGHALPGMGGILDVLDSPLLAAPVVWFFWTRVVGLSH